MTDFKSSFAGFGLALAFVAAPLPALADTSMLPLAKISATGSYLAGRQAMADFDTAAAARYDLDAARADWNNPDIVYGALEALLADGQIAHADDLAKHLLVLSPNTPLAELTVGTVALKQRRYESAIRAFSHVRSNTFLGITGAILAAWAQVGNNQYDAAQKTLDAISRNGLEDFLLFHRALMADVVGRSETALGEIERAYKSQPDDPRLVDAYVRMLANKGDFAEAEKVLAGFAGRGWTGPAIDWLKTKVDARTRPGKLAPSVQRGAAEMYFGIGQALSQDGSADMAAIFYNFGLYLAPRDDSLSMALAGVLEKAKRYERANAVYERIAAGSPFRQSAMVRAAENIEALGDRDEAIRRLHNLAVTQPDNFDAVVALANQLRFAKKYGEAAKAYSKAIDLAGGKESRNWSLYYARGISYERNHEWPKAEADFQTALGLNPGQPQVLNYLGYSWVDQGVHLDKALAMIKEAIDWDPSDGYVVDSLGWAYFRLGRIADAVQTLEQAVQLRPNDPEINDHLGDAYWAAGRKREARFQWTIAADLDKTGDVKARALDKLKNGYSPADSATAAASEEPGTGK